MAQATKRTTPQSRRSATERAGKTSLNISPDAAPFSAYLMTEENDMHLKELSEGLYAVGMLIEEAEGRMDTDERGLACIFYSFSTAAKHIQQQNRFERGNLRLASSQDMPERR